MVICDPQRLILMHLPGLPLQNPDNAIPSPGWAVPNRRTRNEICRNPSANHVLQWQLSSDGSAHAGAPIGSKVQRSQTTHRGSQSSPPPQLHPNNLFVRTAYAKQSSTGNTNQQNGRCSHHWCMCLPWFWVKGRGEQRTWGA